MDNSLRHETWRWTTNSPLLNSAALGTFLMERYSPAHRYPQSFGVKMIFDDPDKDLAIYFDYEVEKGMDEQMAELVEAHLKLDRQVMDALRKNKVPVVPA